MFPSKKNVGNVYKKRFIYFPLNNSSDVAWHISERYKIKRLRKVS